MSRLYGLGLRGRLPGRPGCEVGTLPGTVVIIGFKRETRIIQPMLGLGIQSGGVSLGVHARRSLECLAGIAHGLHWHGHTPRKNEHAPDYKAEQRFFHESTLAAARSAVKQIDGATITHLVSCWKKMKKIVLYHNPRCSKSRSTKALLEEHGVELNVIEYLKTSPGVEELKKLAKQLGIPVREMMRTNEKIYGELQLDDVTNDDDLLEAIAEHPILLQRPIAVAGNRAAIGRPPENVLRLL